jgi:hypothetical protein
MMKLHYHKITKCKMKLFIENVGYLLIRQQGSLLIAMNKYID